MIIKSVMAVVDLKVFISQVRDRHNTAIKEIRDVIYDMILKSIPQEKSAITYTIKSDIISVHLLSISNDSFKSLGSTAVGKYRTELYKYSIMDFVTNPMIGSLVNKPVLHMFNEKLGHHGVLNAVLHKDINHVVFHINTNISLPVFG